MIYDLDCAVRTKMFGRVMQEKAPWHNGMRAPSNILLYGLEGSCHIEMEGKSFTVGANDLLLIPEHAFYRPLAGGKFVYYFFHFAASSLNGEPQTPKHTAIAPHSGLKEGYAYTCLSQYSSIVQVPVFTPTAPITIRLLFERAAKLRPHKSFSEQLLLDHLLREILLALDDGEYKGSARLNEITEYIEQNYPEAISLSRLSAHFGLSMSYIARLFREELGQTPSAYVNMVRVSVASTLLIETNLSVAEIAEKTGFSDVYYFSRVFKKIVGCSPIKMKRRGR